MTVASLWGGFGAMWGALWAYGGANGSPGVSLGLLWFHFGSIVGSLLGYEGGFWGIWRVLWGHSKFTLGLLLASKSDFGFTFASPWLPFLHI